MKQKSFGSNNIQCGGNLVINGSNKITSDGIIISGRKIYVNGKEYDIPEHIKCHSTSMIDGKIYIDGYEFKDGKWKRTLASIWNWVF